MGLLMRILGKEEDGFSIRINVVSQYWTRDLD
jgi:hypothetical protein